MLILITVVLFLICVCLCSADSEGVGIFFSVMILFIWFSCILGAGYNYKGSLISYRRIDENIALVQEQTTALDKKIKSIEIKGSLSLGDSPYKSIIETYNKNMESLLQKKERKIELENYILSSELGMFRHTNKFLVKKELIIKKE